MRILGRSTSPLSLLLLIPLGVLSLPLLLGLIFVLNDFAGAVIGPPAIWNRPLKPPAPAELIGRYSESERRWSEIASPPVRFELRSDGSASAWNLPCEVELRTCVISGAGNRRGPDEKGQVRMDFSGSVTADACHVAEPGYASFALAGHSAPYRLYLVIEDPDSGTGIWFDRRH